MADQPVLHTDRLTLRPFAPADAPVVQAIVSGRDIADTTLNIPHPYPDGGALAWIATHGPAWQAGTGVTCAVVARDDGTLLGAVGLNLTPAHARGELGYWVRPSHAGRGYCTEAARALVGFAFGTLGLHRVEARHFVRNVASGRVMQKLGMRLEGVHRDAFRKWDRFEDSAVYAVLADEWTGGA